MIVVKMTSNGLKTSIILHFDVLERRFDVNLNARRRVIASSTYTLFSRRLDATSLEAKNNRFSFYKYSTMKTEIWPRGFPLEEIHNSQVSFLYCLF